MTTNSKPGTQLALVNRFAARVGVEPAVFKRTIKATVLKTKDREATDEEMVAFLAIADKYGLDPWTKEIHAFVDKGGGIVPIVGVDGWNHIANDHKAFDGEELRYPPREEWVQIDKDAKLCPPWMEAAIYRKDRAHPTVHREYLDECYVPARSGQGRNGAYTIRGHWQTHTKRALEHKTRIQARRIAFGFSGIYDEDEAARIIASSEQADPYVGGAEVYAEAEACIDAEALAELLALAARKGLSREQLERQLRAKGMLSGPLEEIGVGLHGELMAALSRMPPPEPEVIEAEEDVEAEDDADFWPADVPAPPEPAAFGETSPEPDEEDLPGVGAEGIDEYFAETGSAATVKATARQLAKIAVLMKDRETAPVRAWMREQWGITSRSQLSKDQAGLLIEHLTATAPASALEEGVA